MKLILATTAAIALSAVSASAFEIGQSGLAINNTVSVEHNLTSSATVAKASPELVYVPAAGLSLTASTDLFIYNEGEFAIQDTFSKLPTLDLEANYKLLGVTAVDANVYIKGSYDLDAMEGGDVTLGVSFAF